MIYQNLHAQNKSRAPSFWPKRMAAMAPGTRPKGRVLAGALPPHPRFCRPLGLPRVAPHDRCGKIVLIKVGPAPGHEPWASPGLPWPWAMSLEPWAMNHQACLKAANIEKSRKLMLLRFCKVRCREKNGGWVQELFPTHPTYQNPIYISPGPLLCKVSGFFGFSLFAQFFSLLALLDTFLWKTRFSQVH
jgi:hypothetical protein